MEPRTGRCIQGPQGVPGEKGTSLFTNESLTTGVRRFFRTKFWNCIFWGVLASWGLQGCQGNKDVSCEVPVLVSPSVTKWGDKHDPDTGVWPFQVGLEMAKYPVSPGFRSDLRWPNTPTPENTTQSLVQYLAVSGETLNSVSHMCLLIWGLAIFVTQASARP